MSISPSDFLGLVRAKQRGFTFTVHALGRAEKRLMQLEICKDEVLNKRRKLQLSRKARQAARDNSTFITSKMVTSYIAI